MNEMMLLAASSGQSNGGGGGGDVDPDFKFNVFLSAVLGAFGSNNSTAIKEEISNASLSSSGNTIDIAKGRYSPLSNVGWWTYFPGASPRSAVVYDASTTHWAFTGDFKIQGYFVWLPGGDTTQAIIGTGHSSGTPWEVMLHNTQGLIFVFGASTVTSSVFPAFYVRNHFEINRTGTTLRLFLNGVQIGTLTSSATIGDNATARIMRIGNANNTARSFRGLISNIHVEKGIGGNTSNYTPPTGNLSTTAYTVCLTLQTPYSATLGPATVPVTTNTGTVIVIPDVYMRPNNAAYDSAAQGGSVFLNNAYLNGTAADIAVGSGDYTIDGWVNMMTTGNGGGIFSAHGTSTNVGPGVGWVNTTHALDSRTGRNSSGLFTNVNFSNNLPQGQWVYLKACKNGTTLRVWFNNLYRAQVTTSRLASTSLYRIGHLYGSDASNAELFARAYIAFSRFKNVAENTSNSNISIPTAIPAVDANTKVFLSCKDQAAVVDLCQASNVKMYTGASVSDAVQFLGLNSVLLDGANGCIQSVNVSPFYYLANSEDWEFEGHFQPSSNSVQKSIVTIGTGTTAALGNLGLNLLTSGLLQISLSNGSSAVSFESTGYTVSNNVKHCVAVCWTASTKTIDVYLDGTRVISQTNVTGYAPTEYLPRINIGVRADGVPSTSNFHGYMGPWRFRRGKRTIFGATYAVPTTMYPAR